jgi:hypothetical protein
VNFTNKRLGRLISRKLRNLQQDHLSSIPVIEVDDHFFEDEIDKFLDQEDVDDQFLGNEIDTDVIKYTFISNLPPFLKNQEGFSGIQHDMKKITGQNKTPSTK